MLLHCVARDVTSSLFSWHNDMILMPQIFDVMAIENARYKRKELEYTLNVWLFFPKLPVNWILENFKSAMTSFYQVGAKTCTYQ